MLQLKESKNIVTPKQQVYNDTFDLKKIESTDRSKSFNVHFDPVNKLVLIEFLMEEDSLLMTLNAQQAVSIGQWLTEAGVIVNFIEHAGIEFENSDDDSDSDDDLAEYRGE